MAQDTSYIIRGGIPGRERLRILSRVMQPTTLALLQRAGVRSGMVCLDVGCGSGDLSFDMAHIVGAGGKVVGIDMDETKVRLAREQAGAAGLANIEFRVLDIANGEVEPAAFDLVHARFVLCHIPDPLQVLKRMRQALRPGGVIVVTDVDFRGYFCHPDCQALWRHVELYTEAARRKGADPHIGPRLPALLREAGFENVNLGVVQLAATTGEMKLITALTMENIADTVLEAGLASAGEVAQVVAELYEFAASPDTLLSSPRFVEAWGQRTRNGHGWGDSFAAPAPDNRS
jgi:ubiquinone/menaquinone biosynthesis C-methylase UbiE